MAEDLDVKGEVGYRFTVQGPTYRPVPRGPWYCKYRIIKGSLPPNLILNSNGDITGIPTEPGHWIVTLEQYDVYFNGSYWWGFTQRLLFHMGGGGPVHDGKRRGLSMDVRNRKAEGTPPVR